MTSIVGICNQALIEVGGNLITSLTDPSTEAQSCSILYDDSRDCVLEAREWVFAVSRRTLASSTTKPDFGNSYQLKVPSDCLRVLECFDQPNLPKGSPNPFEWTREGEYIHCNAPTVYIRYLKRISDPNQFSAGFTNALIMYLASKLAIPIQRSRSLQENKYSLYERRLAEAASTDGMQGRSRRIRASTLLAARNR